MTENVFIGVPYWLGRKDDYSGSVDIVRESGIASEFDADWIGILRLLSFKELVHHCTNFTDIFFSPSLFEACPH